LNRITQKTYPDNSTVIYTYDNASRLTQVSDPTGTYQFTFDNMGRLTGTTTSYSFLTGRNFTASYGYDAASNRTGFTDPEGGATAFVYDTLNRLQTLTPPAAFSGTGNFGFSYDALSRRTQLTRPNAVTTTYGYDTLSRLLNVTHKKGTTTLDGATYTVDSAGNRLSRTPLGYSLLPFSNTTPRFCLRSSGIGFATPIGSRQLTFGGKKIFQNWGAGDRNSTGTSEPPWLSCAGRTTFTSTRCCVLGFSSVNFVPAARPSARIIMAPLALTVCVNPWIGFVLPVR
jgi:YD repeat-containing protein